MYLHVLLFLSWLLLPQPTHGISTTTSTTAATVDAIANTTFFIAKPGCQLKCGSLTIPYPFGIGVRSGCSIDPEFDITCDNSSDPPKAFRGKGAVEILSISQTQVRVRNTVASACYNSETGAVAKSDPVWIQLADSAPYTISDVANKFTVVGCDDYGWISGTFGGKNLNSGCMSQCTERRDVSDKTGYCQTNIPKGVTEYNITLSSFNNHTTGQVSSFNKCSYAFLGEKDSFKFHGESDFSDPNFMNRTTYNVPIVLDYAVGHPRNQTCAEAQNSSTSLCLDNASCNDTNSGNGGYFCSCNKGYKGNPYLSPGCEDIDECENPDLNDCDIVNGKCINTPGSNDCSCNPRYDGDGKYSPDGQGCTPKASQFPAIKFSLGLSFGFLSLLIAITWLYFIINRRKITK